ncbi:uncharacterized protein LOC143301921 [Babylonia areolata]|uniref:uncharacterized protein LOC143301921 n=1 Tax=Babylonia areolata TaxID=304850 RepID=UPI003FCFC46A
MDADTDDAHCSICLEEKSRQVQGACVPCGHTFCLACIHDWMKGHSKTCPQCRLPVEKVLRLFTGSEGSGGNTRQQTRQAVSISQKKGVRTRIRTTAGRERHDRHVPVSRHDEPSALPSPRQLHKSVGLYVSNFAAASGRCVTAVCRYCCRCCRDARQTWRCPSQVEKLLMAALTSILVVLLALDLQQPNGLVHGILAPRLEPFYPVVSLVCGIVSLLAKIVTVVIGFLAECVGRVFF